jgi:uncharacterized protein
VEPDYLLGNIKKTPMFELAVSKQQRKFGQDKLKTLPKYCRDCQVLFACQGEVRAIALSQHPTARQGSTICALATSCSSPMSIGQ